MKQDRDLIACHISMELESPLLVWNSITPFHLFLRVWNSITPFSLFEPGLIPMDT